MQARTDVEIEKEQMNKLYNARLKSVYMKLKRIKREKGTEKRDKRIVILY